MSEHHNRLTNVKTLIEKKIPGGGSIWVIRTSSQVHMQDVERHIDTKVHKTEQAKLKENKKTNSHKQFDEAIAKLNHAFTVEISTSLNPTYSMSPEFFDFLYIYGNIAKKYHVHPLSHLHVHRQTMAKHGRDMGIIILSELKELLKTKLASLKNQSQQINQVVALSLDFDHAYSPAMKIQIGLFALTVRSYETTTNKVDNYCIPVKTFVINGKGDQTAKANAQQIRLVLEEMSFLEEGSCCSIAADGGIVKPSLFNELGKGDFLHGLIFFCNSHNAFLVQGHTLKNVVDDADCGQEFPKFFPNHIPSSRKLFLFGDEDEAQFKSFLRYFFNILSNLETCSKDTKIRLTDYITEIQNKILIDAVKNRHKEYGAHADKNKFEEELLQDMQHQVFTASNPFQYFMDIYFNQEEDDAKPLKTNPLKIPNDPGRKSRRMSNMITALIKTIRYADVVVRNHFQDAIKNIPQTPFSNAFNFKVGEFAAFMKLVIFYADSADSHNISMYRLLCLATRAALRLHQTDIRLQGVLSNPFTG